MKKSKLLLCLALALVVCLSLVACDVEQPEPTPAEVTIELNTSSVTLDVYDTVTLTPTVNNSTDAIAWTSSDATVAMVADGVVTALKEGTTTITATVADKSASCLVTVTDSHTAPVIRVERTDVAVDLNAEYELIVEVLWKGNAIEAPLTWTLADGAAEDVAKVTATATGGTIKGDKYGDTAFVVSTTTHGATVSKQINVSVRNSAVSFDAGNLVLADGAYTATVALVDTADAKKSFEPTVKVMENNVAKDDVTLTWTSDNDNVVAVEDGKFVAKGEGTATLTTSYQNVSFTVKVNCIHPTIALDTVIEIETARPETLVIDAIEGNVSSVKFNDIELFKKVNDAEIVLDSEAIPTELDKMGAGELVITTDLATYTMDAGVYTLVVRNVDDYATMQDIMLADAKDDWKWGGYFVLGNDIDAQGATITNKVSYAAVSAANSLTDWWNGHIYGFNGIIDGRGYAISNATFEGDDAGIAGVVINNAGIVRNLSLLNVTQNCFTLITRQGGITQNVFITIKSVATSGNQWVSTAPFMASASAGTYSINNSVVVYLDGAFDGNPQNAVAIGAVHTGYNVLNNVYAIGAPASVAAIKDQGNQGGPADIYGSYATAIDFAAAVTISAENGWDMSYWTTVNGIAIPKNLEGKLVVDAPVASIAKEIYYKGEMITVSVGSLGKIVLSDEAVELGVTVNGNEIVVPDTLAETTVINFSVVNLLDETKKTDLSFTAHKLSHIVMDVNEQRTELELNNSEKTSAEFAVELAGDLESIVARIGETAITASIADDKLAIDLTSIPNSIWGEQTIVANVLTSDHYYTINVDVLIITKVIRTVEDYATMQDIMLADSHDDCKWGGYFVLGNDIDANGATLTSKVTIASVPWSNFVDTWWNNTAVGFIGVLDGRGYSISNAVIEDDGTGAGIIGYAMNNSGVVRNLSLLNVTQKSQCLIARFGGYTENVYFTIKSIDLTVTDGTVVVPFIWDGGAGRYKINNSIVVYLDGALDKILAINPNGVKAIGAVHTGWGVLNGVYAIGAPASVAAISDLGNQDGPADVYGSYATVADFAAAVTVSAENGWDMNYWTVVGGMPMPKTQIAKVLTPNASTDKDVYYKGETTVTVSLGSNQKIVLSEQAVELGITVSGNVITLPDLTIEERTVIAFTVVSTLDETYTQELSFTIAPREKQTITINSTRADFELNNATATNEIAVELDGTVEADSVKASIDGYALTAKVENGKLIITDTTAVPNSVWGNKTLVATVSTNKYFYTINVDVLVLTKVIRTVEDYTTFQEIMFADAIDDWKWGGYFVLGNDIDAQGATLTNKVSYANVNAAATTANESWYVAWTYGFTGVFDGRGYAITNAVFDGGDGGIVGFLIQNNGIVRNLSLLNVTQKTYDLIARGGGQVSNVFITIKSVATSGNQWVCVAPFTIEGAAGAYSYTNCVAIYLDGAFDGNPENAVALGGFHTKYGALNNVYAIGSYEGMQVIKDGGAQGSATPDKYGAYTTVENFAAAVTVSAENGWDMSYWTTTADGAPIPVALATAE